jgi:hypothetical protein
MKDCWLLQSEIPCPEIIVAYISVTIGQNIDAYAPRFARTYKEFPPDFDHRLVIVCNGGTLNSRRRDYFKGINCEFLERKNDEGKDISAYQQVASENLDSAICCFGESIYFHRRGWLLRLAQARAEYGVGMYGIFSSHYVRAHLNTTGFLTDSRLLARHKPVLNNEARYAFEHSHQCFWKRVAAGGGTAALVTWDNIWFQGEWRCGNNIMHRGDQSNCLAWCNHTSRWENADPNTKTQWTHQSDSPFRV